ncbi:MAG: response regulator [Nitrospinae bacterium]|nr:response regulator [Nitrospinota bacterium]
MTQDGWKGGLSPEEILDARILLVDDNPTNIELLELILQGNGYRNIRSLTNPQEVVPLYRTFRPDLLILDLNMPFLDGFQVMRLLKDEEEGDYLPILVLTAKADHATRIQALKAGAKDFLTKPFDHAETLNRIRNILEVRLLHMQSRRMNVILEEKVRERTAELEESRKEVILRLGRAAEYRDNETGAHIKRMSELVRILALATGMDEGQANMVSLASQMHDIGKIGIPDAVLLKPGKLTPEEFDIIKTHPGIGGEVLSEGKAHLTVLAREIALTHHEKWDGSGYPAGLSGEAIPLAGRLTALADVFDALTSIRPYKRAWSHQEARDEIVAQKGRHFDPRLVELFLENYDAFCRVAAIYPD